jgi:hypothetical protein
MKLTLVLAAFLLSVGVVDAQVAFNNFGEDDSYDTSGGAFLMHSPIFGGLHQMMANGFTAEAGGSVTDIVAAISLRDAFGEPHGANVLYLALCEDEGGAPSADPIWSETLYDYMLDHPGPPLHWTGAGPALTLGEDYWLTADVPDDTFALWYNNSVGDVGPVGWREHAADPWQTDAGGGRMAFRIEVPEPGMLGLFGVGLLGVLRRQR